VVIGTARRRSSVNGLRPLSLARDWRRVIELIEIAFGETLDVEARRALHSMRLPTLLVPFMGLADSLSPPGEGMMPGFVWVQDGNVVGTASVRRVHPFRNGWLISNVAVHPDWQGRGIGRALLEASVDLVADHGGAWVVLQVRDDNLVAQRLYESLGFHKVGEVTRLRRVGTWADTGPAPTGWLRPARWSDGSALCRLARTVTPHGMLWADAMDRNLYQTGPLSRLTGRLQGYRRWWWVIEVPGYAFQAAVGVEVDARNPWHRLRLLVLPEAQDKGLASNLIAFGLAQLAAARPLPAEIEHPASDEATQSALTEVGFEPVYAMVHMRLDLRLAF
jgi:ribosomal protein S18 acetylase RimI-like enzyme